MAFVKAALKDLLGSREVTRGIGEEERTDTFARVILQADALPSGEELPTIGAVIEGLADDIIVDTGSYIRVLDGDRHYIMGQDLNWHEVGGA